MEELEINEELIEAQNRDSVKIIIDPENKINYFLVENNEIINSILVEDSEDGENLVKTLDGLWIKDILSYPLDQKPGISWIYNPSTEDFRPPKPFNSWTWSDETWGYQAPTPIPVDEFDYIWSEDDLTWRKLS